MDEKELHRFFRYVNDSNALSNQDILELKVKKMLSVEEERLQIKKEIFGSKILALRSIIWCLHPETFQSLEEFQKMDVKERLGLWIEPTNQFQVTTEHTLRYIQQQFINIQILTK